MVKVEQDGDDEYGICDVGVCECIFGGVFERYERDNREVLVYVLYGVCGDGGILG